MEALLQGIISGITISFLIGPIFFALAEITISKGYRSGLAYVAGVLLSDVVLIYIVENILNRIPFDYDLKLKIGIFGGLLLIAFGFATFISKSAVQSMDVRRVKTLFAAFLKGVSINVFNPFVTLWWITMYTTVSINFNYITDKILFYFGILFMVFLFDLLKMRFAFYLKQNLNADKLYLVKKTIGAFLVLFGVIMIYKVI